MATRLSFAHLRSNPDRLDIYRQPGSKTPDVLPVPRRPGVMTLVQAADQLLAEHGWKLGPDGWRTPLDPGSGIIATAHLIPVGSPR
jgi:hypothetical protein